MKSNKSRIKIIGGRLGGRFLEFPDTQAIRPTPNRLRETLFNWLMNFVCEANCLDAFSGSGALGFEALSRGAQSVCSIEKNRECADSLRANAMRHTTSTLEIIQGDFFEKLPPNRPFDLIFLDPPFHRDLLIPALDHLIKKNSLSKIHRIYFEVEKEFDMARLPSCFEILKNKVAGQVRYGLLVQRGAIFC